MNVLIGAVGLGFGFAGSVLFLVESFPLIRNPRKVAQQQHDDLLAEAIQGQQIRTLVKANEIEPAVLMRGRYYQAAAVLLALGFLLQMLSLLL